MPKHFGPDSDLMRLVEETAVLLEIAADDPQTEPRLAKSLNSQAEKNRRVLKKISSQETGPQECREESNG